MWPHVACKNKLWRCANLGSPLRPLIGQHGDVVGSNRNRAALQDMRAPRRQRSLPLRKKLASLIDRCNALNAAADMVQQSIGHMRRKARARQPSNGCAPEVMEPPDQQYVAPASFAMAASKASFALLNPLGAVVPVTLNTKSCPAMRGTLARISRAGSAR